MRQFRVHYKSTKSSLTGWLVVEADNEMNATIKVAHKLPNIKVVRVDKID